MSRTAIPTRMDKPPRAMNMALQPLRDAVFGTHWKPKEINPPIIWAIPMPEYQRPNRGACSLRVYHWLLNSINVGGIGASRIPDINRRATMPAKFSRAAWQAVQIPHAIMQHPRIFAAPNLWRGCTARLISVCESDYKAYLTIYQRQARRTMHQRKRWTISVSIGFRAGGDPSTSP